MTKKDPYLSLLKHLNKPIDGIASPAQIVMSWRLSSTIPTTKEQFKFKADKREAQMQTAAAVEISI